MIALECIEEADSSGGPTEHDYVILMRKRARQRIGEAQQAAAEAPDGSVGENIPLLRCGKAWRTNLMSREGFA